jgi:DNA-binding PadR family transcriptional regulator
LEAAILNAAAELRAQATEGFHGFQIARHVSRGKDERRLTAYGTLYRALARLEKLGLLESRWEDPQVAADQRRPVRRLYTLTAAGVAAVDASRQSTRRRRSQRHRKVAPA